MNMDEIRIDKRREDKENSREHMHVCFSTTEREEKQKQKKQHQRMKKPQRWLHCILYKNEKRAEYTTD